MSFSLVETGVPGEKKLRADYFSLPLFFYLQCLKQKELKKRKREGKRRKSYQDSLFIEIFLHAVFIIL